MKKYLVIPLLLIAVLAGCGGNSESNKTIVPYIKVENEEVNKSIFKEDSTSIPINIIVLNMTDVDIGMFSLIDPKANEAVRIAPIESQKYINLEVYWPKEEKEISWALYNKDGGLCIEGKSEVTGIKESATITFTGEGNVTGIDVQID